METGPFLICEQAGQCPSGACRKVWLLTGTQHGAGHWPWGWTQRGPASAFIRPSEACVPVQLARPPSAASLQRLRLRTPACTQVSLKGPPGGRTRSRCQSLTLRAISLLPRGWGLACPAIGSTGHDPTAPLAGTWLSRRLAFAVPWLSPFNFHLDK